MADAVIEMEAIVATQRTFSEKPSWDHGDLPEWFAEAQRKAWKQFVETPMPKRTDEEWRFASLKKLAFDDYLSPAAVDETVAADLITRTSTLEKNSAKLVFANDRLIADPLLDAGLTAKGVICKPLEQALREDGDLVRKHFMNRDARLGSAKFAALNVARASSGVFVYVPAGVEIEHPIEIYHWLSGDNACVFPHTLVVTGDNAKVSVIDYFASEREESGFACSVADLVAGPGSHLKHVCCQNWAERARSIHISSTTVGADADVKSLIVNLGTEWSRSESVSHLVGKGANSDMLSVCIPEGSQEMDQRTLQLHEQPHTTSDLLYKNALYDQSRTIFAGLIMVGSDAHFTDAYQTCRNLLLSEECEANAMPGLEINADQVKCSHGSTSSPITEEELFYLKARGISDKIARQLVTFGFVNEAIARLENTELEEVIQGKIQRRFDRIVG
jgi:Fe-S cluster assembly protein SufD